MIKAKLIVSLLFILVIAVGCVTGLSTTETSVKINGTDLTNLAAELSHELLVEGMDTVAVVDFTDPDGYVTEFEKAVTEQVFLAMAGFTGKLWVLSGDYLKNLLSSREPRDAIWHVMGVKAVVYGTIRSEEEKITLCLNVVETETAELITEMRKECHVLPVLDSAMYLAQPTMRSRKVDQFDIPRFPWPPPEASASSRVPSKFLMNPEGATNLAEVAHTLETALNQSDYAERSYYAVPGGFALVTRLEQFNPDGTSKQTPERWAVDVAPPKVFSLASYLQALFMAKEGHFRIITFIVTSSPFIQSLQTEIRREEAMEWLATGIQILPYSLGKLPYTEHHYCVALIYEFEQPTRNHDPYFKKLSTLPGVEHLKRSQLWGILEK